jgi:Fe(3+) dicitrate transport protein
VIDPHLKDSRGYDIDLGYRGQFQDVIQFDVNGFYLFYGNKIGKLTRVASNGSSYQWTTNIGNSVAKGFESYVNVSLLRLFGGNTNQADVRVFSSAAYTDARYVSGALSNNTDNISIVGKRVEGVPAWINRTGIEWRVKGVTTTLQASHVSNQFNDANNTTFNATGVTGVVPAYTVYDWSFAWHFLKLYQISGGVNNLTNAKYFSRRINMYPGPGILPADGRTVYVTVGVRI